MENINERDTLPNLETILMRKEIAAWSADVMNLKRKIV